MKSSWPLAIRIGTATALESLRDFHGDTVGTFTASSGTTAMTDQTWYSPFGEPVALSGALPRLGFQGQLTDPATGTVDMLTRQYVPSLGRFATRDVLGGDPASPPSLNQWVYAQGSPVTFTDPTGLCAVKDCPAIVSSGDVVTNQYMSEVWDTPEGAATAIQQYTTLSGYDSPDQIPEHAAEAIAHGAAKGIDANRMMNETRCWSYEECVTTARRVTLSLLPDDLADRLYGETGAVYFPHPSPLWWEGCGLLLWKCVDIHGQVGLAPPFVVSGGFHTTAGLHVGWGVGKTGWGLSFEKPPQAAIVVRAGVSRGPYGVTATREVDVCSGEAWTYFDLPTDLHPAVGWNASSTVEFYPANAHCRGAAGA